MRNLVSTLVSLGFVCSFQAGARTLSLGEAVRQSQVISLDEVDRYAADLWEALKNKALEDTERVGEHTGRALNFSNQTMRFSFEKIGEKPQSGYPVYIALHGGGGTAPAVNDSQWRHMQVYYKDAVKNGIYIAPRGVTDTWNLHFVDESYPLYDHLIENMIAYEGADPNRIYLTGFSAGGDGVYQVVPRMADRWAAANMSAGHHNWVPFKNLFNTPFLIQVGEYDNAYNRNHVAVINSMALDALQYELGGYIHDVFVHAGRGHNGWYDNHPQGAPQQILADPKEWHERGSSARTTKNTNAVLWMNQYQRQPFPKKVIWDLATQSPRPVSYGKNYVDEQMLKATKQLFYWLTVGDEYVAGEYPQGNQLIANVDEVTNMVDIQVVGNDVEKFGVRLNPTMVDYDRPVRIQIPGHLDVQMNLEADLQVMAISLLERGDPAQIYTTDLQFRKVNGKWEVTQ